MSPSSRIGDELDSLVADLGTIAERLADLAIQSLRDAISKREQSRPQLERQLTRARHAVERAIGILTAASDEPDDEDADLDASR